MPGLSMGFRLEQRLEQRLEMRLELTLRLSQELSTDPEQETEDFYDDLWGPDYVPPEMAKIKEHLIAMAHNTDKKEYLILADAILGSVASIAHPHFRMLAIGHLAEELSHQPALANYVNELYAQHFRTNLMATPEREQHSLVLMVAASQLRAGLEGSAIERMVTDALNLATKQRVEVRGSDMRNLRFILSRWPASVDDLAKARAWVDGFVALEQWVPDPEEQRFTERPSPGEIVDETNEPERTEPAPQDAAPAATATTAADAPVPARPTWTARERAYLHSRLIQKAMPELARARGISDALVRLCIDFATHDQWEETATVMYRVLADAAPLRAKLREALGHFASDYYRAKAAGHLAQAEGNGTAAAREVTRLLDTTDELDALARRHERAHIAAPQPSDDPLHELAPEIEELALPAFDGMDATAIRQWASAAVERMHQERLAAVASTAAVHAEERHQEAAPSRTTATEEAQAELEEEEAATRKNSEEEEALANAKVQRRGELYTVIARTLIERNANTIDVQIAALKLVAQSRHAPSIAEAMIDLPAQLAPQVRAAADEIIDIDLAHSSYHRALAHVYLLRPSEVTPATSRKVSSVIQRLIEASAEEEDVSNLSAIVTLTHIARNFQVFKNAYQHLLTHVRKRLKLYDEKIEEYDDLADVDVDELDDHDHAQWQQRENELKQWKHFRAQAQAQVLASEGFYADREESTARHIVELGDPYLQAQAFWKRSYLLLADPQRAATAVAYFTRALTYVPAIPRTSLRVGFGMQMLDNILEQPPLHPLMQGITQALGNPYAEYETSHLIAHTTHAAQENWYATENLPQLIQTRTLPLTVLGRFLTAKQINKMAGRGDLTSSDKSFLIMGYLNNGPFQRAFDIARTLIEQEEAKPQSPHLNALYQLFEVLLQRADHKALAYLHARTSKIIDAIARGAEPRRLSPHEWHWLRYAISSSHGKNCVPLMYAAGLHLDDRITLIGELADYDHLDPELKDLFRLLRTQGRSHLFFAILQGIHEALPGITITRRFVEQLLDDPRMREDERNLTAVITSWAMAWQQLNDCTTAEELIRLLVSSPLLAERYYREQYERYDFGTRELSLDGFMNIVLHLSGLTYGHRHEEVERYEQALERTSPTSAEERTASIARIESAPELEDAEKMFLTALVRGSEPLHEADILRIAQIGRDTEMARPELMLPPHRQRIYRLYWGEAPLAGHTTGDAEPQFLRVVAPQGDNHGAMVYNDAMKFRFAYEDVIKVLRADWAFKEMTLLLRAHPECVQEHAALDALIGGTASLDDLGLDLSRLHTELVARLENMSVSKARGKLHTMRRDHFTRTLVTPLLDEDSLVLRADGVVGRSARYRDSLLQRSFEKIYPNLNEVLQLEVKETPRKAAIAARLGFAEDWARQADLKVAVEVELIAELTGLTPALYERYFTHHRDAMRYHAQSQTSIIHEQIDFSALQSRGRYAVRFVEKRDVYTFMRIGDFRPCCIASDGMHFLHTVPVFHRDRMTLVFAIYDPDNQKAVGHMIGHLGLHGKDELPAYYLNGLYLRTQHKGKANEQAAFAVLEEFARLAGIKVIRHGMASYPDLTERPPEGFSGTKSQSIRLQTVVDDAGTALAPYNDLGFRKANEAEETTHYQKKVR